MAVIVLCVAQVVIVLDVTIVAIALPAIGADLGLPSTGLAWVMTAYTLVSGGCLLAAGRLADSVGRRRAFVAGLALFGLASLVCGSAPSGPVLLAGRALQGLGAALAAPAALALLTDSRPDGPRRTRALGWWTAAAAGGGASGWALGGLLSGLLGWRWVFLVNVPVCLVAAVLGARILPSGHRTGRVRTDLAGTALSTTGLAALVLALTLVESHGPAAGATLAVAGAAILLLAGFVAVERRAADPLLNRTVLRAPRVLTANAVAAVLTAVTTPPMFLAVLHAQDVLGLSPAAAGLLFPPFNLAVIAGSLAGPRVVAATGDRTAMAGGLAAIAAGALALCAIAPSASALASTVGGFLLMGAGLGVASVASTAIGTAAFDRDRQGLASGLLTTSAHVGTVLGLAVVVPLTAAHTAGLGGGPRAEVAGFELGFTVAATVAGLAALEVAGLRRSLVNLVRSGR